MKHSKGFVFLTEGVERHWLRRFKIGRMVSHTGFAKHFYRENMAAVHLLNTASHHHQARLIVILLPILLDLGRDSFPCTMEYGNI